MKTRYCGTPLQRLKPCDVGWGNYTDGVGSSSCGDEPLEKNCRNIVDTDDLYCPYCGGKVEMDEIRERSHIRYGEAWQKLADEST